MKGPLRGLLIAAGVLAAVVGGGLLLLLALFPPAKVKALVEAQASKASGYRVTLADARLAWGRPGLAIRISGVQATAPDGSQELKAPEIEMNVAIGALLARRVEVRRLRVRGLDVTLSPPASGAAATAAPAAPPVGAAPALLVPRLEITEARVTMTGPDGTNRLEGVTLAGALRQDATGAHVSGDARAAAFVMTNARDGSVTTLAPLTARLDFAGGAAGGTLEADVAADSLVAILPPPPGAGAAPAAPLRLPGPGGHVKGALVFGAAPTAELQLNGRLGPVPFSGTVASHQAVPSPAWVSQGRLTLGAAPLDSVRALLPAAARAPLAAYALGGRCEGGTFEFATRPAGDSLDYTFTTRLTAITASLPDKGRVVDDGAITLTVTPTRATAAGQLRSGASTLTLDGGAGLAPRAPWRATLKVAGPAAEALRFMPPQGAPQVTAGRLDLDVTAEGRVGDTAAPTAAGRITLESVAFRHPALAVPVSRLDLRANFTGDRARVEAGQVVAGKSSARFTGEVVDFKHPQARFDIAAGTLDLDELFPAPPKGAAKPAAAAPAAAPPAALPVSGRLTIDSLHRDKTTLTGVTADYALTTAGMEMKNLAAGAFGGRVTGNLSLTPTGAQALDYRGNFEVTDAKLGEMLGALTPVRGLDGRIQTSLTLSGRNAPDVNPIMALTLDAKALVLEGALANVPAVRRVAEALSFNTATATSFPFKAVKSRFKVQNGFVNLDSCLVTQPNADWTLAGRVGLDGTLDVPIRVRLAASLLAERSDLRRLADALAGPDGRLPVTLKLSGTVTAPQVSVDLAPLVKQAEEKAKGALGDELKKRLGGLLKKPGR